MTMTTDQYCHQEWNGLHCREVSTIKRVVQGNAHVYLFSHILEYTNLSLDGKMVQKLQQQKLTSLQRIYLVSFELKCESIKLK